MLEKIISAIKNGYTITVSNNMHAWAIDLKVWLKFESLDRPVLIERNGELYMSSGKKYVCIIGCRIVGTK